MALLLAVLVVAWWFVAPVDEGVNVNASDGVVVEGPVIEVVDRGVVEAAEVLNDAGAGPGADGAEGRAALIAGYREVGYGFLLEQRRFLEGVEDDVERRELDRLVTLGNQLMLAGVVQELALDGAYSETLAGLLNDSGFRGFMAGVMVDYSPALVVALETGDVVEAERVGELFAAPVDFAGLFEELLAPRLPEAIAANYEAGIAHALLADVMEWEEIREGRGEREGAVFLWGARVGAEIGDPNGSE